MLLRTPSSVSSPLPSYSLDDVSISDLAAQSHPLQRVTRGASASSLVRLDSTLGNASIPDIRPKTSRSVWGKQFFSERTLRNHDPTLVPMDEVHNRETLVRMDHMSHSMSSLPRERPSSLRGNLNLFQNPVNDSRKVRDALADCLAREASPSMCDSTKNFFLQHSVSRKL